VKRKMNFLSFIFLDEVQAKNPFKQIETFLKTEVIDKLLGMWWVGAAAALCFMAQSIVKWLEGAF
jgi:hypothetical protein